jgi:hypothetical protein
MTAWFSYLDTHAGRNQDRIFFGPYGEKLESKGFRRIDLLKRDLITPSDLEEWLGIDTGTAFLILHYAQEDIAAIKEGKLNIPEN